jgi:hypothetical protein
MQQGEAGGTAGGERLADAQVDEEPGDPGPVGGTVGPSMTAPAS